MTSLFLLLVHFPIWLRISILAAVILIILETIFWYALSRYLLYWRLKKILATPEKAFSLFFSRYNENWILARSNVIEKFAERYGRKVLYDIKMDELWIMRLVRYKRKIDFIRVLKYAFEKGGFKCFLVSLKKPSYAEILLKHIDMLKELFPMRKLSLSCEGEDFDRLKAYNLYRKKIIHLKDLSNDPEWRSRYFSISLLLYNNISDSKKIVFDALNDPCGLIRKIVVNEAAFDDKSNAYEKLLHLMLNDPIYEVRKSACRRIKKEYIELYKIDPEKLSDFEIIHLIELMETSSKDDESLAMIFLKSNNLEIRLASALFLEKTKTLERLLLSVHEGDKELIDRNLTLLNNAFSVNVTNFISSVDKIKNKASFFICSKLLIEKGDVKYITSLCRKIFKIYKNNKNPDSIYINTVKAAVLRGDNSALEILKKELFKNRYNKKKTDIIFFEINDQICTGFSDILLGFLKDEKFIFDESSAACILKAPQDMILPELINIIRNDNERFSRNIIIRSLKLLQRMKLTYGLQIILENYHLFTREDAEEYGNYLKEFPKDMLYEKIENLLSLGDARLNISILSGIPFLKDKNLIKFVKEYLSDPDPDIRRACIKSIIALNEIGLLENIFNLLYDPVERVRLEASKTIAQFGKKTFLDKLKNIYEKEESLQVKKAILSGLGASGSFESISFLINKLETDESVTKDIIESLSGKTEKKEVLEILAHFKKASFQLKEKIIKIFINMDNSVNDILIEILHEDNPVLKPFITEILEKTGYINSLARKLRHRNPEVRKEVLSILMLISTNAAYKVITLASRDPLPEIRSAVLKAYEKLESSDGKEILKELKNDPDKKVRLYSEWAIEKLKAKEVI